MVPLPVDSTHEEPMDGGDHELAAGDGVKQQGQRDSVSDAPATQLGPATAISEAC